MIVVFVTFFSTMNYLISQMVISSTAHIHHISMLSLLHELHDGEASCAVKCLSERLRL